MALPRGASPATIKRRQQLAKRRQAILHLKIKGLTLEEIGKHFGISKERVRQIVLRAETERP